MAAPGPLSHFRVATALRETLAAGYGASDFRADLLAGLVVGIVALPLAMALGIASGVPPQHGLYTAIVAGGLIALLGGSRAQVSGPTAAFIAILAPITAQYGVGGLMVATMLAGGLLIIMALGGLGRLISYIPYPVTMGFTTGIAVVIATGQLKDLLGLTVPAWPPHFPEQVATMVGAADTARLFDLLIGLFTLAVLILWPRLLRNLPAAAQKALRFVPAPLVGLALAGLVAYALHSMWPSFDVVTIGSKYAKQNGIPQSAPMFALPWSFPGPDGEPLGFSLALFRELASPAVAIALLGAIESLLSAVIADGLAGTRHDPDAELFAQGVGNLVAPFFGGIAATGAIARTGTNIRAGARSPVSAVVHALFVLIAMLALAPVLNFLPMASMAALLLMVAWNMSEIQHFLHTLRHAPALGRQRARRVFPVDRGLRHGGGRGGGHAVGLAALHAPHGRGQRGPPDRRPRSQPDARPAEGRGALRHRWPALLRRRTEGHAGARGRRAPVLGRGARPGRRAGHRRHRLVNLESALKRLARHNTLVVLSGVRQQPLDAITKAGILSHWGHVAVCNTMQETIELLVECAPTPAEEAANVAASDRLSRLTPARGNEVVSLTPVPRTDPPKDSPP
jgi:MFS superfamily sulfate permease-like transporter